MSNCSGSSSMNTFAMLLPNLTVKRDHQYTLELEGPVVAGEGKIVTYPANAKNLHENLLAGVKATGDGPFLGSRSLTNGVAGPYEWQSYNQVYERVKNVGAGLVRRGLKPDSNIGLFSINIPKWIIAEHACYMYGLITVPLYDTLGNEAIEYIVGTTETSLIFTTADKAAILVASAKNLPAFKTIVLMSAPTPELIQQIKEAGLESILMEDLEKEGLEHPSPKATISGATIATLCYTSGTTGMPKGVILTHANLLSFTASYHEGVKHGHYLKLGPSDCHISYLPLAHVFERIIQGAMTNVGAQIGFYQGDTLKLLDDVAELKPTVFASVPRLYNRIYDKIRAGIAAKGGVAAMLFQRAFDTKKEYFKKGYTAHTFWDALVFSKVKARLGGKVRFMMSGAAPIAADVVDFMRVCFCADFLEGYGQTETTGGVTTVFITDLSSGHVGIPLGCNIIKLRDVPAMKYTSQDKPHPRGEICIKGANVFSGYYKAADKTAESLVDGWVLTGDIGMWDEHGRLKVIDRVKNIFKLAQGEYIAPEKIEVVYNKHELIAQSFVYGDSLQAALVAIIVPDWETLRPWCLKNGYTVEEMSSFEIACRNTKLNAELVKILNKHGKDNDLKGYENAKAIHLIQEPFTPESGLMSPTFKLKRHEAKKEFQTQIDAMYKLLQ